MRIEERLDRMTSNGYGPDDLALSRRGLLLRLSPELGYGAPSKQVVALTAVGFMTAPALFFPSEAAARQYLEDNAGSELDVALGARQWDPTRDMDDGPLAQALFLRCYSACGDPGTFRFEQLELTSDHDGDQL